MNFAPCFCLRTPVIAGLAALLSTLVAANVSQATLLPPGGATLASGVPDFGGAIVAGPTTTSFNSGTFTGTLTTTVMVNDLSNPFDVTHTAGDLTFTYQIADTSGNAIDRFTLTSLASTPLLDVSYATPTSNVVPFDIDRSSAADGGKTVGFNFDLAPLSAGTQSAILVIHTPQTAYTPGTASFLDGAGVSISTSVPVPEPTSLVLAAFGLAALLVFRKRRSA